MNQSGFRALAHTARAAVNAVPARTKLVSSANTESICAVNVSGRRHTTLVSRSIGEYWKSCEEDGSWGYNSLMRRW